AAGPEPSAAHLMRIRFARHPVRQIRNAARMRRGLATREARHRQISTAPEVMNRTALADDLRAEIFENAFGLHEDAPISVCVFGIVRAMNIIRIEPNRIRKLAWHRIDLH